MGRACPRGIVVASVSAVAIIGLFVVLFSNGWYFIENFEKHRI